VADVALVILERLPAEAALDQIVRILKPVLTTWFAPRGELCPRVENVHPFVHPQW
jgi:hypothetical protein